MKNYHDAKYLGPVGWDLQNHLLLLASSEIKTRGRGGGGEGEHHLFLCRRSEELGVGGGPHLVPI